MREDMLGVLFLLISDIFDNSAAPCPKRSSNNTDFVDTLIPNVLRDLHFTLNEPLKLADDQNIRTVKV